MRATKQAELFCSHAFYGILLIKSSFFWIYVHILFSKHPTRGWANLDTKVPVLRAIFEDLKWGQHDSVRLENLHIAVRTKLSRDEGETRAIIR